MEDTNPDGNMQKQYNAVPLLAFMVGGLFGAALQSLCFGQWIIALVEGSMGIILLLGASLGATFQRRGE